MVSSLSGGTGRARRGTLAKMLFRDMRENAMQFVAMILLCFLGTWVFSGLDGTWRLMDLTVETYFEECNLSDFWVSNVECYYIFIYIPRLLNTHNGLFKPIDIISYLRPIDYILLTRFDF